MSGLFCCVLLCPHRADDTVFIEIDFREQSRLIAVIDEAVGKPHAYEAHRMGKFVQNTRNLGAGATDHGEERYFFGVPADEDLKRPENVVFQSSIYWTKKD